MSLRDRIDAHRAAQNKAYIEEARQSGEPGAVENAQRAVDRSNRQWNEEKAQREKNERFRAEAKRITNDLTKND
jgi:hypothetical protein